MNIRALVHGVRKRTRSACQPPIVSVICGNLHPLICGQMSVTIIRSLMNRDGKGCRFITPESLVGPAAFVSNSKVELKQ
jgi:hypothetical protein